jgi:NAD(P)-dependent dehydrogenase (short-subunit alcohol dehydrogenase family)
VAQNLSIALETARQLLPLLAKGGQFLHISTQYLAKPVRGFSHYLTAKAAQEILLKALALEFGDHTFIVARLPRILTDQTNLPFDFDPPQHPGEIAKQVILALAQQEGLENYREIHLFEL